MLVGIDGALLGLVVDGAKQSIPVEVTAVDHRRFLLFVMNEQIDQHRMLEFQTQRNMSGQIGEEVIDLGIVVLLAHDAGHQPLGIKVVAHQLEQFANHLAELDTSAWLQAQPDRFKGVVEVLGVAEVEQIAILAVGGGNQGTADIFVIGAGEPVEQHDRAVTIKTG